MANRLLERKHYFHEHIFDLIDTPEKAYWLGVLYTDGCVTSNGFYTKLETKDRDWLELFKKFMNAEHPLLRGQGTWFISIGSKYLNETLHQYGIIPNKTYDYFIPVYIPKGELESHYWRGCMDGDGCIGYYPTVQSIHQRCRVILCNKNAEFLELIKKFFIGLGYKSYIALKHSKNSDYYHWSYGPRPAYLAKEVLDVLYKDSSIDIRLERKYNTYMKICEAAKELSYVNRKPRGANLAKALVQINDVRS